MDPANDLDLLVVRPDGSLIWGTDPEGLGNHERVFIPEPMLKCSTPRDGVCGPGSFEA